MNRNDAIRRPALWRCIGVGMVCLLLVGTALAVGLPASMGVPGWVAGAKGAGDERDADVMPAVAYDSSTRKYLAVWLTPRHAGSQTAGLDVYAVFLNQVGQPMGQPFRISDSNNVARNALPTVAAAPGGRFAVAWTVRGNPCRIAAELVTRVGNATDKILIGESVSAHTPHLAYQPARDDFMLTFVSGEDYLPPKLFGSATADCGNNPASKAKIDLVEFAFINGTPTASRRVALSAAHGAFRPQVSREYGSGRVMVVWEDRRAATTEQPYRFDVYGQQLGSDLTLQGSNLPLATGGHYYLEDDSSTWTPRPVVAGGENGFLAAWFDHEPQAESDRWSVQAALVPVGGPAGAPFTVARTTYSQSHAGSAPTGGLAIAFNRAVNEFMVGFSLYTESFMGYLSSALVQRVDQSGQLLRIDGSVLPEPGVGWAVDYAADDQLFVALAANPYSGLGTSDVLTVFSKRLPQGHGRDMDIFGVRVVYPASKGEYVFLPSIIKR